MLTPGNVLHGNFSLNPKSDDKYCIVLHRDNNNPEECVVTIFTTGQKRSVSNPVHGRNELVIGENKHLTYVFKAGKVVGENEEGKPFSFPSDSTVVADYGIASWTINELQNIEGIHSKCTLYDKEFKDLLYTLLKSEDTVEKYKPIIEIAMIKLYPPT